MSILVKSSWEKFLSGVSLTSPYHTCSKDTDKWGDSPELADELGALIASGVKTATCSALWEWEFDGDVIPQVGHLTMVLNGSGEPLCIIEITEMEFKPFDQVDAQFAYEEGEGDRSLEHWREAHQRFFERACHRIGRRFAKDIPLVCERFKVVYKFSV
jgi:uncharacterized protein YhfF